MFRMTQQQGSGSLTKRTDLIQKNCFKIDLSFDMEESYKLC